MFRMTIQMILVTLFFVLNCYADEDPEFCLKQWEEKVEKLEEAKELMTKGLNSLSENPERAWDLLNKASSIATTYQPTFFPIWMDCKDVTNLTEKMVDQAESTMRELEFRSKCGRIYAFALKQGEKLNDNLDDHLEAVQQYGDSTSGLRAVVLPQITSLIIQIESVITDCDKVLKYNIYCDDQSDILKSARHYRDDLIESKISFFKKKKMIQEYLDDLE